MNRGRTRATSAHPGGTAGGTSSGTGSGSARAVAADVVARVLDDNAWTQPALAAALSASALDARDKGLCTELAYGTLRWAAALEKSVLRSADKPERGLDKKLRPHLLVAAYQLQHLSERIPAHAAVNEAVDNVKAVRPGLEGFANALLRRLGSPMHTTLAPDASVNDVADAMGIPHLLADAIARHVDASELKDALMCLNARPTTFAYVLASAVTAKADVTHNFVPRLFTVDGPVVDVEGFAAGEFLVADPGSVVAALVVGAKVGMRVLDLCAAPGGKTAILADAVGERGRVFAVEKSAQRAIRIKENIARTNLDKRVELVIADVAMLPATVRAVPFDAVLLDAPCTGFGTTRRKPEVKMRRTQKDVDTDVVVQRDLLRRAAALVKPGGVLVYSVCSPIDAEGADQIEAFLAPGGAGADGAFVVDDVAAALPWLPADAIDARGFIRLFPHRHEADAFFIARLRRRP